MPCQVHRARSKAASKSHSHGPCGASSVDGIPIKPSPLIDHVLMAHANNALEWRECFPWNTRHRCQPCITVIATHLVGGAVQTLQGSNHMRVTAGILQLLRHAIGSNDQTVRAQPHKVRQNAVQTRTSADSNRRTMLMTNRPNTRGSSKRNDIIAEIVDTV